MTWVHKLGLGTMVVALAVGCRGKSEQPATGSASAADSGLAAVGDFHNPAAPEMKATAPATFRVKFETSRGDFVVQVTREWAPVGADRFYALARSGYFDGVRFFRVLPGFVAQFGMHGDPAVSRIWFEQNLSDDPVRHSNTRGTITFATAGPNTRTTQLFINYGNNTMLDGQGFSPFGEVVEGMAVVDSLHAGYGEGAPRGRGPDQGRIRAEGNAYLERDFANLDYVKRARVLGP